MGNYYYYYYGQFTPVCTKDPDGSIHVDWPEDAPTTCRMSREVLLRMVDSLNRMRAAGDALAKQASQPCRCVKAHDGAINETCAPCAAYFDWQEARRER